MEGDRHRRQGQPDLVARRNEPGDRAEARTASRCSRTPRASRIRSRPASRKASASSVCTPPDCRARSPTSTCSSISRRIRARSARPKAQWAIADSDGKARVVILTHNEYAIAEVKSMATKAAVEKCAGCKVLEYVNSPASEAAQRQPQLTTSWVQRFGLPLYGTSVGDNDWDFAVPVLRAGGVAPDQVKLVGADGNRSAYDRIRKGGPISGRHGFRADRAAGLSGDRRTQSRVPRPAAERLRAAAVPGDARTTFTAKAATRTRSSPAMTTRNITWKSGAWRNSASEGRPAPRAGRRRCDASSRCA